MNRIIDHGDTIEIISGGPDEWAASNAIIAQAKARWQADADAQNGEGEVVQTEELTTEQPSLPKPDASQQTLSR